VTATTKVGGNSPESALRRSAMTALTSVRGKEAETFKALARFVRGDGNDRGAAIRAISRINAAEWPVDEAAPTLDSLLAYVKTIFENGDIMPHNFVVTRPGALEEVGLLGESTATQPGAIERQYVPPSSQILVASRLLAPRESQKISFTAPSKPGVYPYVCTY